MRKLLGAVFGGPRAGSRTVRCNSYSYFFHFLPPLLLAASDVRFERHFHWIRDAVGPVCRYEIPKTVTFVAKVLVD